LIEQIVRDRPHITAKELPEALVALDGWRVAVRDDGVIVATKNGSKSYGLDVLPSRLSRTKAKLGLPTRRPGRPSHKK
jgi:hypothetical protein